MYRHASLASLAGAVGHTAEERLDILENRDRIIRAGMSLFVKCSRMTYCAFRVIYSLCVHGQICTKYAF